MQQVYLLLVLTTFVLFSTVSCTPEEESACRNQSNTDCWTCVRVNNCAYCKTDKKCMLYNPDAIVNSDCKLSEVQWRTCVGNARVWIIVVVVLVALVVLVILIVLCCLCRKCKQCKIRKFERREQQDARQMEERRAAAEARTADRTRVTDQIRMKYGVLKEKEAVTDYARMS